MKTDTAIENPEKQRADGPDPDGERHRVLIIDDDDSFRAVMEEVLSMEEYEVVTASHAREGLALIKTTDFDVILTDIIMPDIEGIELIMKVGENHPRVYLIAMSGGGMVNAEDYLECARDLGADTVLKKPFSFDQLHEVLEAARN